jgi:hypothetical protein
MRVARLNNPSYGDPIMRRNPSLRDEPVEPLLAIATPL